MNYKAHMQAVTKRQAAMAEQYYSKSEVEARHRLSLELLCQRGLCTRTLGNGKLTYVMQPDGHTYQFDAVVA